MLNSVPESMRACLIEAAKLAGPAFKRKMSDPPFAGAASGSGPLSFNISVDAGRGPPAPAAGAVAAFATAAAGSTGGSSSIPNAGEAGSQRVCVCVESPCQSRHMGCGAAVAVSALLFGPRHLSLVSACVQPAAESDPLISGLMVGALGSDPLLGPLPPLSAPPSSIPTLPLPQPVQAARQVAGSSAAGPAASGSGAGAQQLLNMGMLG